jgi:hypothetical protein
LNGKLADASWAQPKTTVRSEEKARKGLSTTITKTEYADSDVVLNAKVKAMA